MKLLIYFSSVNVLFLLISKKIKEVANKKNMSFKATMFYFVKPSYYCSAKPTFEVCITKTLKKSLSQILAIDSFWADEKYVKETLKELFYKFIYLSLCLIIIKTNLTQTYKKNHLV